MTDPSAFMASFKAAAAARAGAFVASFKADAAALTARTFREAHRRRRLN